MEIFKIDQTDIILQDMENGKGKIIISDSTYGYNFSYYWGAMGCTLKEFLADISPDYFVNKLSSAGHGDINMKKTLSNVREWWKKESGFGYWQYMDVQKELRYQLREMSWCTNEHEFISCMNSLKHNLPLYNIAYKWEREDFEQAVDNMTCEPWNFIDYDEHREHIWLTKLHSKIKAYLSLTPVPIHQ